MTFLAGVDVHASYINQGVVEAGQDIYVEKSILHSTCIAINNIQCRTGSNISGHISAGKTLEVKGLGNRMNSFTQVYLGTDHMQLELLRSLNEQHLHLTETLKKLTILGEKLATAGKNGVQSDKMRIMKLKQENAYVQTEQKRARVEEDLYEITTRYENGGNAYLNVWGTLYRNVVAHFEKYAETIMYDRKSVQIYLCNRDIHIQPLHADRN